MTRSAFSAAAFLCLYLSNYQSALGQCEPVWSRQFVPSWPAGDVLAAVNYDDDGDGPHREAVILAGNFLSAGSVPANHIVKWDGTWWSPLGAGLGSSTTTSIVIFDMVVFDPDGPGPGRPELWVTGYSDPASGGTGNWMARWNGLDWAYITGPGTGTPIRMLAHDASGETPSLYVAMSVGPTTGAVWRLSGGIWTKLGADLISNADFGAIYAVNVMRFYDDDGQGPHAPQLVVAGSLIGTNTGPVLLRVARWTGQAWEPLGTAPNSEPIWVMEVFDRDGDGPEQPLLITAGYRWISPTIPTSIPVNSWNGSTWISIGTLSVSSGGVWASSLKVFDSDGEGPILPRLWMAGRFRSIVDQVEYADGLAWWDGVSWHDADSPDYDGAGWLYPLRWPERESSSPKLLTCPNGPYGILKLGDGENWLALPEYASISVARAPDPLSPSNDQLGNDLIAAGIFTFGKDPFIYPAVRWNGFEWQPIGGRSARGFGHTIARVDPDGLGPLPPTIIMFGILQVEGSSSNTYKSVQLINDKWVLLPVGSPGTNSSDGVVMEALDPDGPGPIGRQIYSSGRIASAPYPNVYGIGRWTGTGWEYLPGRFDTSPSSMTIHDEDGDGPLPPALIVGKVGKVDGVVMNGIARWNGTSWSQMVSPLTGTIGLGNADNYPMTLLSFDPDGNGPARPVLYAGGEFAVIDGTTINNVGFWNGAGWKPMGAGFQWGFVRTLAVIDDDGAGPRPRAVFAGGSVYSGQYILHVSRWDGVAWEEFADQSIETNSSVRQLIAVPISNDWTLRPSIWGIGSFTIDNNPFRQSIARFGPPTPFFHAWSRPQLVTSGSALAVEVAAGGAAPLVYQWRLNGEPLTDGAGISGATTSELSIAAFNYQSAGQYDCVVANPCGSATCPSIEVDTCFNSATPDINGDGAINGLDIQLFVFHFLSAPSSPSSVCHVDLNGNHAADAADASVLVHALLAN